MQIVKASIFGVPLPLCSCSVIPVTASLRKQGASGGATVSFLTSTPQTGADSILATWGMLGPVFAAVRVGVAFVSGVVVGWVVERMGNIPPPPEQKKSCCCSKTDEPGTDRKTWREALYHGLVVIPDDIGKSLLLGIALSALITVLVPANFFEAWGGKGLLSMLIVMLIGLPLYVCSTGSIPIALSLLHLGFTPGAALVFLITGPATNGATFTTMHSLLGRRATVAFLAGVGLIALVAGWGFDIVFADFAIAEHVSHLHEEALTVWHYLAVGALLIMMFASRLGKLRKILTAPPQAHGNQSDSDECQVDEHKDHKPEGRGTGESVRV
jgi:uncharacterized membrane protein YraQ (UPF0718 family)